jgi:hypothetical protein
MFRLYPDDPEKNGKDINDGFLIILFKEVDYTCSIPLYFGRRISTGRNNPAVNYSRVAPLASSAKNEAVCWHANRLD